MSGNPEGIVSFSPGVARHELPWVSTRNGTQPWRGCINGHTPTTQPFQGWKLFCGLTYPG